MTLEEKKNRAFAVTIIGAGAFGIWQSSFFAGLFMAAALLFFGGLVVAVEDHLGELVQSFRHQCGCPKCVNK